MNYSPNSNVPSNGSYVPHYVGGGHGPASTLQKSHKFPSTIHGHSVSFWTGPTTTIGSTGHQYLPGQPVPKDGTYTAHYRGGTGSQRLSHPGTFPARYHSHTVFFWT